MKKISKSNSFPNLCIQHDEKISKRIDRNPHISTKEHKQNNLNNRMHSNESEQEINTQNVQIEYSSSKNHSNHLKALTNELIRSEKSLLKTNEKQDPLRVIKITEIIELADKQTNLNKCDFLNISPRQHNFLMHSHSLNSPFNQFKNENFKEIPIKIEKFDGNFEISKPHEHNAEIVLEILNYVNKPNQSDNNLQKPKKIIVKITGRTKSLEPKSPLQIKENHYENENFLNEILPIKTNPVKIGTRIPYHNFKPILKPNLIENKKSQDEQNGNVFDLEKFKSFFNNLNKSNRSFSMPPNNKPGILKTESTNFKSSFKIANKNYACSDSEDLVWTYNDQFSNTSYEKNKNMTRSSSTNFNSHLAKKIPPSYSLDNSPNEEYSSTFSLNNDCSVKTEPIVAKRGKDIDLYQTSLRRNFKKSDFGKNYTSISSYYNKYYLKKNEYNRREIGLYGDNLEKIKYSDQNDDTEADEDLEISNEVYSTNKDIQTKLKCDVDRSVHKFQHNHKQSLSTFLPIRDNRLHISHIKSHSISSSPNRNYKLTKRVIFADEIK
ncbi:unnamed protein product [Brachionus calyciflorus]|uniref:Uncharacterized protein n=1 Tax=Brachionus calyciflorus TaxID=104777 RepID=A0A813MCS7_9BILA|nr:unnamed protein product [Brachionus calyciflorus]